MQMRVTYRVIENLDVASILVNDAALINVVSKQIIFHCDCDTEQIFEVCRCMSLCMQSG